MKFRKDAFITGFIPGLILPLIGFWIYFMLFFNYMDFKGFYHHVIRANLFVSVLSLGVILNLGIFFLFYKIEADRSAKGVIAATFLYAFMVIYFKVLQ
ncbi:hypothetical protein BH11BAC2_BH11BAC2_23290 [soil metagenome]